MLDYEGEYWRNNKLVAGIDEVGRGAFAGPVYAAAVVFDRNTNFSKDIEINDSKKLNIAKREAAHKWIVKNSAFAIASASVDEINKFGVTKALDFAISRALDELINKIQVDHILIDGRMSKRVHKSIDHTAIIKGDSKSVSIAAASIIAKVTRDKYMRKLSQLYEHYGWETNVGYGTKDHREAIVTHGICDHHRRQFVQTFLKKA